MVGVRFFKNRDGHRIAYADEGQGAPLVLPAWWVSHLEPRAAHLHARRRACRSRGAGSGVRRRLGRLERPRPMAPAAFACHGSRDRVRDRERSKPRVHPEHDSRAHDDHRRSRDRRVDWFAANRARRRRLSSSRGAPSRRSGRVLRPHRIRQRRRPQAQSRLAGSRRAERRRRRARPWTSRRVEA